jgi:hypothetical protein
MFCARRIIHRRGYWQGHSRQLRGTSRGARSANPVTFRDDHRIDLVTVTAQILMPVHTLIGRRGSAESTAAVERVVERIAWKYPGFGCSEGTFVWHRCR